MNDDLRKTLVGQISPDPNAVNWTEEQGLEELDYHSHEDNEQDSPKKINFMNEFDETFGKILFGLEEDSQDNTTSTHHVRYLGKINEVNMPLVQIYKREKGKERPFPLLDWKIGKNKDEEKELAPIPVEYGLNINIEKGLDKITQNIPLTEIVKISSIKSQVNDFFDRIHVPRQDDSRVKPFPGIPLNITNREEEDLPIDIRESLYKRKNGRHETFYLTLHIGELLLHN